MFFVNTVTAVYIFKKMVLFCFIESNTHLAEKWIAISSTGSQSFATTAVGFFKIILFFNLSFHNCLQNTAIKTKEMDNQINQLVETFCYESERQP